MTDSDADPPQPPHRTSCDHIPPFSQQAVTPDPIRGPERPHATRAITAPGHRNDPAIANVEPVSNPLSYTP